MTRSQLPWWEHVLAGIAPERHYRRVIVEQEAEIERLRHLVRSADLELHFLDERCEVPSTQAVRGWIRHAGLSANTEDD